jgi:hypothetical protein
MTLVYGVSSSLPAAKQVKNSASLSYALACSNVYNTFAMYRELTFRNLLDTSDNYRNFSKGRKNLLEVTKHSISINYEKKSMVVGEAF